MISPAVPSLVREINERRTIEILRAKGALHAAEIARLIGLSRTTMAEILRELVEAGLVQEYMPGEEDSRRADRKSTRLNSSHVSESRMPSSA